MTTGARTLRGLWLGTRAYRPVLALQEQLWEEREKGCIGDTVLLLEHTPVVTLGRGADPSHVLLGEDALRARGWDWVPTTRGGDVTLHAPGQLVGYPIVDLRPDRCDVRRYVKDLCETMRRVVARHGVVAGEVKGLVGLWVDRGDPRQFPEPGAARDLAKLGAVGVRISRWVTMHGFALNLTTSPDLFSVIVPCGIRDHGVTSLSELTGIRRTAREEASAALSALQEILGAEPSELEDWSERELPTSGVEVGAEAPSHPL